MLEICEVAGKCELEVTLTVSHLFNTIPSKMWCSSRNNGAFSCIRSQRTNAQHRWCRNTNIDWNLSLCRNPEFEIVWNRTLFKQQYWTQNSLCWIKEYHWIPGAGRWHPRVERRYSRPLSNTILSYSLGRRNVRTLSIRGFRIFQQNFEKILANKFYSSNS